ncbi:hypothetical protein [Bradyrhizobium elkanii]|uniref:hypothetical protein n=1 Tax=Bradyrhizobium elkanii TaxID=29448 RepID=UPI003512A432
MAKSTRPQTNTAFVQSLMEFSKYGALAQLFVIDALDKMSERVSQADPAAIESPMISGEAWVGVAKEIQQKLKERR